MNALRAPPADPNEDESWAVESLRFAPRHDAQVGSRREGLAIVVAVGVLHLLFWWAVEAHSHRRTRDAVAEAPAIVVSWIEVLPRMLIRAERAPVVLARAPTPPRARSTRPDPQPVATRPVPRTPPPANAPLQLYLPDGRLRIPDGLLEDIDRAATQRQFDFQMPNLDEAARLLDRPPALVYEPTRFDEYWEPNETLLDEVLRKAVEKTTKEVRIPIPGAPGRRLVCRVSLLAAGGACGMERNGGNDVVSLDDPKTLNPTEAAACAAWWARITSAASQAQWRATRALYDRECRKPLAKVPPQAKPEPAPATQ